MWNWQILKMHLIYHYCIIGCDIFCFSTQAMFELLRYTTIAPILVPHLATQDTTLGGYTLPQGTQIWANVFKLHHDMRYWERPSKFNPHRFLDGNGEVVPPDHMNRKRLDCLLYLVYSYSGIDSVIDICSLWLMIRPDLFKMTFYMF